MNCLSLNVRYGSMFDRTMYSNNYPEKIMSQFIQSINEKHGNLLECVKQMGISEDQIQALRKALLES